MPQNWNMGLSGHIGFFRDLFRSLTLAMILHTLRILQRAAHPAPITNHSLHHVAGIGQPVACSVRHVAGSIGRVLPGPRDQPHCDNLRISMRFNMCCMYHAPVL